MRVEESATKQLAESALRAGRFSDALAVVLAVARSDMPRAHAADWAALARRAHRSDLGLKWLHPIVRPPVPKVAKPATNRELCEYALALQRAGALGEAENLAASIDPSAEPRALMALAYVKMASWNYEDAAPLWQRWIDSNAADAYERSVAEVNRTACWISTGAPNAADAAQTLVDSMRAAGHSLLLMNALELLAQARIQQRDFDGGEALLADAESATNGQALDALFVAKWRSISQALRTRSAEALEEFRARALELRHWETLRDLDFYRASLAPDSKWAAWAYFGTPYASFRRRLDSFYLAPDQAVLSRREGPERVVDLWRDDAQEGSVAHRCFAFLARDLYRPARAASIFSGLFEGEHFNPNSSPARVHKAIERARAWIAERGLPCRIEESHGAYSLRMDEALGLLARKRLISYEASGFMFGTRRDELPESFDASDWRRVAGVGASAASKQLAAAVDRGVLIKSRFGRDSAYRFA